MFAVSMRYNLAVVGTKAAHKIAGGANKPLARLLNSKMWKAARLTIRLVHIKLRKIPLYTLAEARVLQHIELLKAAARWCYKTLVSSPASKIFRERCRLIAFLLTTAFTSSFSGCLPSPNNDRRSFPTGDSKTVQEKAFSDLVSGFVSLMTEKVKNKKHTKNKATDPIENKDNSDSKEKNIVLSEQESSKNFEDDFQTPEQVNLINYHDEDRQESHLLTNDDVCKNKNCLVTADFETFMGDDTSTHPAQFVFCNTDSETSFYGKVVPSESDSDSSVYPVKPNPSDIENHGYNKFLNWIFTTEDGAYWFSLQATFQMRGRDLAELTGNEEIEKNKNYRTWSTYYALYKNEQISGWVYLTVDPTPLDEEYSPQRYEEIPSNLADIVPYKLEWRGEGKMNITSPPPPISLASDDIKEIYNSYKKQLDIPQPDNTDITEPHPIPEKPVDIAEKLKSPEVKVVSSDKAETSGNDPPEADGEKNQPSNQQKSESPSIQPSDKTHNKPNTPKKTQAPVKNSEEISAKELAAILKQRQLRAEKNALAMFLPPNKNNPYEILPVKGKKVAEICLELGAFGAYLNIKGELGSDSVLFKEFDKFKVIPPPQKVDSTIILCNLPLLHKVVGAVHPSDWHEDDWNPFIAENIKIKNNSINLSLSIYRNISRDKLRIVENAHHAKPTEASAGGGMFEILKNFILPEETKRQILNEALDESSYYNLINIRTTLKFKSPTSPYNARKAGLPVSKNAEKKTIWYRATIKNTHGFTKFPSKQNLHQMATLHFSKVELPTMAAYALKAISGKKYLPAQPFPTYSGSNITGSGFAWINKKIEKSFGTGINH